MDSNSGGHATTASLLITECLQNDFVKPIGRLDALPNRLHVGYDEARRMMGEIPSEGPVSRVMKWACAQSPDRLAIIHIRDWHDHEDPNQSSHLELFGPHCIAGTPGAAFAFDDGGSSGTIVDSPSLNDFHHTQLDRLLDPFVRSESRVGLIGVWTDAKISFLAYELRTRYPDLQIATCAALTAGSSTAQHFIALDQIERLLGVRVFASIGEFTDFLAGERVAIPLIGLGSRHPSIVADGAMRLLPADETLLRYVFRDCRSVQVRPLAGGFSGNLVLACDGIDMHGQRQCPHVVKIGPRESTGKERTAFERIEAVIGNSAPHISEFADIEDRGAIKYRYASMDGGVSTTFQKLYMRGLAPERTREILETVFRSRLGRLYSAATIEKCDLLRYYMFSPARATGVRGRVEAITGTALTGSSIPILPGLACPSICDFYERVLPGLPDELPGSTYMSYVHGDLNGANIVLDSAGNVWLIDFFHAHRGHVLRDLLKLENDLLYIFTPVENEEDLREALRISDALLAIADLSAPLPLTDEIGLERAQLRRAWETIRVLRSFYPELIHEDTHAFQAQVAQLRYAVHTLSFDESNDRQKRWALYTAGVLSGAVAGRLASLQS